MILSAIKQVISTWFHLEVKKGMILHYIIACWNSKKKMKIVSTSIILERFLDFMTYASESRVSHAKTQKSRPAIPSKWFGDEEGEKERHWQKYRNKNMKVATLPQNIKSCNVEYFIGSISIWKRHKINDPILVYYQIAYIWSCMDIITVS